MLSRNATLALVAAAAGLCIVVVACLASYRASLKESSRPQGSVIPVEFAGRLLIPSLDIDAKIESVGLTPDGLMATPQGPEDVGWYSLGSRPGETGSAVLAGHRGWKNGQPAVFDNLDKIHKGDTISIVEAGGETLSFIVRKTRIYGKDDVAPEVFVSSDGAHLNLVTCVGEWDKTLKTSSERWVVFADLAT